MHVDMFMITHILGVRSMRAFSLRAISQLLRVKAWFRIRTSDWLCATLRIVGGESKVWNFILRAWRAF